MLKKIYVYEKRDLILFQCESKSPIQMKYLKNEVFTLFFAFLLYLTLLSRVNPGQTADLPLYLSKNK